MGLRPSFLGHRPASTAPAVLAGHESCGCVDRDPDADHILPGCVGLIHVEHRVLHQCKLFVSTIAAFMPPSSFLLLVSCLHPFCLAHLGCIMLLSQCTRLRSQELPAGKKFPAPVFPAQPAATLLLLLQMGLVLERRRMQQLVASQMPGPASEGAMASGTGSSLAAAWGLTAATAASLASTGSPAASPRTPDLAPGSARAVPGSSMTSLASNEGATAIAATALRGVMPTATDAGEQAGADQPELAKEAPWQAASGAEVTQGVSAEAKAGDLTSSSPPPQQQQPPPLHTGAGPPISFPALSPLAGSPALRPSQTEELLQPPVEGSAQRDVGGVGSIEGAAAGGPSGAGGAGLPPLTSAPLQGLATGYNIILERDFLALLSLAEMLGRSQVRQLDDSSAAVCVVVSRCLLGTEAQESSSLLTKSRLNMLHEAVLLHS